MRQYSTLLHDTFLMEKKIVLQQVLGKKKPPLEVDEPNNQLKKIHPVEFRKMKWILPSGKLTCPLNRDYWTIGNTSTPSIIFQGKNVSFQVKNYQLFHRLGRKQILHIQEVVRVFQSHFSTMGSGSSLSKIRKPGWGYYSHVNTLQTCVCTHLGEKKTMEFHMFFGSLATIGNPPFSGTFPYFPMVPHVGSLVKLVKPYHTVRTGSCTTQA